MSTLGATLLAISAVGGTCQVDEAPPSFSCWLNPQVEQAAPVVLPPTLVQDVIQVFEASFPCWENMPRRPTKEQVSAAQSKGDLCQLEKIGHAPKSLSSSSEGQRILVIDGAMEVSGFLRYHKRVLNFLSPDDEGNYHQTSKTLELPKWMRVIVKDLLGDRYSATPVHLYPDDLVAKLWPEFDKYPDYRSGINLFDQHSYKADHGDKVFPILAEYNPKAEFVLASYGLPDEAIYCSLDRANSAAALKKMASYFLNQSLTLRKWIETYQIDYINFSGNNEIEKLARNFKEFCEFVPKRAILEKVLMLEYENFFKPLSSIKDVIFVQATNNFAPSRVNPADPGQLTLCGKLPNRVLVGSLGKAESGLPPEGNNNFDLLSHDQRRLETCVDLFINGGDDCYMPLEFSKMGKHPVKLYINGLHTYRPMTGICNWPTSFAAPIALSYLIYLKKNLEGPVSTEHLLWCANNGGQGKLRDPALHKQFESYQLGFME